MNERNVISVVIAEDEYIISQDIQSTAREAGYVVAGTASDGEMALEVIGRTKPTLAILDIQMPRMDGLEAARRLRDENPIPVVIMTAYESDEFLAAAKEAGVGAYLVKPPSAASLHRAVELAVARHGDLMELRRINAQLREALQRVRTLEGILPICISCKNIRDAFGTWQPIEVYIHKHTNADFSHGCCPNCMKKLYPEYVVKDG